MFLVPKFWKLFFFYTWVSIRITDGTFVLEKDQISTSVKFLVQKLTARHVTVA
jgi:hypothetical protein